MIGGQIIIPIRSRTGEKINITTTPTGVKEGTFDKIKRAIAMQKELVFEDLIIEESNYNSASDFASDYSSGGVRFFLFRVVRSTQTIAVVFSSNDEVYHLAPT